MTSQDIVKTVKQASHAPKLAHSNCVRIPPAAYFLCFHGPRKTSGAAPSGRDLINRSDVRLSPRGRGAVQVSSTI